ncbi:TetR/AcrR family transcriptional regulator [Halocynthiibacter styelae]|uniref:TetR/AcrR family transcriptional regulator n=1 Tax=Halocynthiibacter styelae TaxID=2761955 RepID=A0A8J7IUD4_9RHOB|nr:TetR/AcrR family transcriptional regulator [Paenihalocynthiibacter styelae]MBI1492543.1 TetR/AcrR family transcriptional regulator [Paenihalocynthiibacter styelae]
MSGKVAARKEALREKLVDLAEAQIAKGGLRSVKARDLAKDAGCALGAIYNAFEDLQALYMAVNGRTFRRLGIMAAQSVEDVQAGPNERLIIMSEAYLGFAAENTNLWRAMFDLEMSTDDEVPDWYLVALAGLFENISGPLSEIYPDMDAESLDLMTRSLFSSVHGIVLLGLEKRISGVPPEKIKIMISMLLRQIS